MRFDHLSVSKLNLFNQCPFKFKCIYIDKLPTEFDPTALKKGRYFHKLVECYISKQKFPKESYKSLSQQDKKQMIETFKRLVKDKFFQKLMKFDKYVEQEISLTVNDCKFKGFIDFYCIDDKVIYLVDWKTGNVSDLDTLQLYVYALDLFNKYPFIYTIFTYYWFVEHNERKRMVLKREQIDEFENYVKDRIDKLLTEQQFKPKKNKYCKYCDFSDLCIKFLFEQKSFDK